MNSKRQTVQCREVASIPEFIDAIRLRVDVFIREQGFEPGWEPDEDDKDARHFVALLGDKIVATARLRETSAAEFKIERMVTAKEYRGRGAGRALLKHILAVFDKRPPARIWLRSQARCQEFYKACGFVPVSDPFEMWGLSHVDMDYSGTLKTMLVATYDRIVQEYADHEFNNPVLDKYYERFLAMLPEHAAVLDAGCGPGHASKRFVARGHQVIGIDLSEPMLEFARQAVPQAAFRQMDVENITLAGPFDGVWAAYLLVHLHRSRHAAVLKKFAEILKPGGLLYLGLLEGHGEEVVPEPYNPAFQQYFVYLTREEIAEKLGRAGFTVAHCEGESIEEEGEEFKLLGVFATKDAPKK